MEPGGLDPLGLGRLRADTEVGAGDPDLAAAALDHTGIVLILHRSYSHCLVALVGPDLSMCL